MPWNTERRGRSAAVAHGQAEWRPTEDYITERLRMLEQAYQNLREVLAHSQDHAAALLSQQLKASQTTLAADLPSELPFLSTGHRVKLRVAVVAREWLLTSRADPKVEDLKTYLTAYFEHSPLHAVEIRLIPTVLRLTLAEKCHILPCPGKSSHMEIIPRLLENLAQTCRLIAETDWEKFNQEMDEKRSALEGGKLGSANR